jgi:hypothetical protein
MKGKYLIFNEIFLTPTLRLKDRLSSNVIDCFLGPSVATVDVPRSSLSNPAHTRLRAEGPMHGRVGMDCNLLRQPLFFKSGCLGNLGTYSLNVIYSLPTRFYVKIILIAKQ